MEELIKILTDFSNIDLDELLFDVYSDKEFQRFAININTEDQLRLGLNKEGDLLGEYQSIGYALFKDRLAGRRAPFKIVDLYVSGRFYRTFRINPLKDGFEIEADTDIYQAESGIDFEEQYPGVVGIEEEMNLEKITNFVEEELIIKVFKKLGIEDIQ